MIRHLSLGDMDSGAEEQLFQLYPLLDEIRSQYRQSEHGEDLLPKLEYLTWGHCSEEALKFGVRLFGSALRQLSLDIQGDFGPYEQLGLVPTYLNRASTHLGSLVVYAPAKATTFIAGFVSSILETQTRSLVKMRVNQSMFAWLLLNRENTYPALQTLDFVDSLMWNRTARHSSCPTTRFRLSFALDACSWITPHSGPAYYLM
jgi:hypothetical protein